MKNLPKTRPDVRLIDCFCRSRRCFHHGTGGIRSAILAIAIGIAFLEIVSGNGGVSEMMPLETSFYLNDQIVAVA